MKIKKPSVFSFVKIPPKYIFSYKAWYKRWWDIYIILLAILQSLIIPFELAFKSSHDVLVLFLLQNFVDFCFLVDVILMMFSSYLNRKGKEIFESSKIAENYVKSWRFVFDILALLGSTIITQLLENFSLFGFFKIVRVRRISIFISRLNMTINTKSVINLIKLMIYLILFLHIQTCVLYVIFIQNAEVVSQYEILDEEGAVIGFLDKSMKWYPPLDWINFLDSKFFD